MSVLHNLMLQLTAPPPKVLCIFLYSLKMAQLVEICSNEY